jgi:hypothetical protein
MIGTFLPMASCASLVDASRMDTLLRPFELYTSSTEGITLYCWFGPKVVGDPTCWGIATSLSDDAEGGVLVLSSGYRYEVPSEMGTDVTSACFGFSTVRVDMIDTGLPSGPSRSSGMPGIAPDFARFKKSLNLLVDIMLD